MAEIFAAHVYTYLLLLLPRKRDNVRDFRVETCDRPRESNARMCLGRVVASPPSAGAMTHAQYKMHECICICAGTLTHARAHDAGKRARVRRCVC